MIDDTENPMLPNWCFIMELVYLYGTVLLGVLSHDTDPRAQSDMISASGAIKKEYIALIDWLRGQDWRFN